MKALALKYRPKTFEDVVEQGSIIDILKNQLETNTLKNCYLFTGGAGTGKTTCARILANEANEGKGNPLEIDAASNNGVESIRELRQDATFRSINSKYKVYIIDECHMLSTGAWNALLKLLEEPPASTIFILCTTDPQKIPATILSRVQRFDFQRISYKSIVDRLAYILQQENADGCNYSAPPEGVKYIAKIADGGMRDAITLLDKVTSYTNHLCLENVIEALGSAPYEKMFDLTSQINNLNVAGAIKIIESIYFSGADIKQFMKDYMHFMLDLCKYGMLHDFEYIHIPEIYKDIMDNFVAEDYDLFGGLLDTLIDLNSKIKWESSPKPLIEATIFLLCQEVAE